MRPQSRQCPANQGRGGISSRQLRRRLDVVEAQLSPKHHDGLFTLEELCREIWRQDSKNYRKIYRDHRLGYFIQQFEREDLESRAHMRGR
jgi:hypothetical protein